MFRKISVAFCCIVGLAGCAGSRQVTPEAEAPSSADSAAPQVDMPDPSASTAPNGPSASVTPPEGWNELSMGGLPAGLLGMYINPAIKAVIIVKVQASDATARQDLETFTAHMRDDDDMRIGPVQVSIDAQTAWCAMERGNRIGVVTVRHLGPRNRVSLTFVGNWLRAHDAAARAAYDGCVKSAKFE